MATILDTLKKGTEFLQRHEVEEARLTMELLIAHVLKVERMQLYIDFDRSIAENQLTTLRELTMRRGRGEPLQHLLGTIEFCDLDFRTDSRALIPRPETEELTMKLLTRTWPEPSRTEPSRILDLGCGSGVIGLSLAHHLAEKNVAVTLADLSTEALSLARENAEALGLDQITLIESDLFSALVGEFHLIVANLPYIPDSQETLLSREVRRDPALALYGGTTGTEIMQRFLNDSLPHLTPHGLLAMEFGIGQESELKTAAENLGFGQVEIHRDMGGIDRFLFATKSVKSQ
ncbi:MAG: peptide chain release factor N(5)-glutamine methyltransferase [Verrucomicrobiales bacterium]|jgi:release factor glutamine methyltransferase|nr:peptide chain release factor N(5)-glutamine methyltransferase [Verrucomicrobiales bacterium]